MRNQKGFQAARILLDLPIDGDTDGTFVGASEGEGEGAGDSVGESVGTGVIVGLVDAVTVGCDVMVGSDETVGMPEGEGDGIAVSVGAGEEVGKWHFTGSKAESKANSDRERNRVMVNLLKRGRIIGIAYK